MIQPSQILSSRPSGTISYVGKMDGRWPCHENPRNPFRDVLAHQIRNSRCNHERLMAVIAELPVQSVGVPWYTHDNGVDLVGEPFYTDDDGQRLPIDNSPGWQCRCIAYRKVKTTLHPKPRRRFDRVDNETDWLPIGRFLSDHVDRMVDHVRTISGDDVLSDAGIWTMDRRGRVTMLPMECPDTAETPPGEFSDEEEEQWARFMGYS